jgi:hypothetical protein
MADPAKMVRTDGTKVSILRHPSWKTEIYGLWVALKTDPLIVLLFPMFFASNWFYTWREFTTSKSSLSFALKILAPFKQSLMIIILPSSISVPEA